MRFAIRIGLTFVVVSITLLSIFGPLFYIVQPKDIYRQMFEDSQIGFENIFKFQPIFQTKESINYKFLTYRIDRPEVYQLFDIDIDYFKKIGSVYCFIRGTNLTLNNTCICRDDWYGDRCSIPGVVKRSFAAFGFALEKLKVRDKPRRVIHAINVNHEMDMLEIRMNELQEAIDVYLICESNFTAFGDRKPLYFYDRFRHGFLREFQDKIVYVFQDHFPEGGRNDGWIADGYQRTFLGRQGLKQLGGLRNDDLFLLLDADEIPKKELIIFLKLHDGFTEPVKLSLLWTVFGFFWKVPDRSTEISAAASVGMLRNGMGDDAKLLRNGKLHPALIDSFLAAGSTFQAWTVGDEGDEVGWHCSWCLSPEDIRKKLNSAQNGDKPRWGDYDEKKNSTYIQKLIRTGTWFDDTSWFQQQTVETVARIVPKYVLQHPAKFMSILINLHKEKSLMQKTLKDFTQWFGNA